MAEAGTINETEQVQQQQEQDPQQQIVVEDEDDRKLFVGGLPQDATQVLKRLYNVEMLSFKLFIETIKVQKIV